MLTIVTNIRINGRDPTICLIIRNLAKMAISIPEELVDEFRAIECVAASGPYYFEAEAPDLLLADESVFDQNLVTVLTQWIGQQLQQRSLAGAEYEVLIDLNDPANKVDRHDWPYSVFEHNWVTFVLECTGQTDAMVAYQEALEIDGAT